MRYTNARWMLVGSGLFCVIFGLSACGSDDEDSASSGGSSGRGGSSATQCDNLETEHELLINAPTDAVVVKKVPKLPAD